MAESQFYAVSQCFGQSFLHELVMMLHSTGVPVAQPPLQSPSRTRGPQLATHAS